MKVTVQKPKGQAIMDSETVPVQSRADSVFSEAHLRLYPNKQYALLYKNGRYVTQRWEYDYKTERVTLVGSTPAEEHRLRKTEAGPDWIQFEWTGNKKNAFGLSETAVSLLCSENAKYEHEDTDLLHPDRNRWFYNRGLGIAPADDLPEKWVKTFHDEADAQKAVRMLAEALKKSGDYPVGKTFTEEYREVMKKMKLYLEK